MMLRLGRGLFATALLLASTGCDTSSPRFGPADARERGMTPWTGTEEEGIAPRGAAVRSATVEERRRLDRAIFEDRGEYPTRAERDSALGMTSTNSTASSNK